MVTHDDRLNITLFQRGKKPLLLVLFALVTACTPATSSSLSSSLLFETSSSSEVSSSSSESSSSSSSSSSAYSVPSSSISMTSYSTAITGSSAFTLGSSGNYLSSETNTTELNVYSIEMHDQYGDATLFDYGNYEILVDGGAQPDGPYVKAALDAYVTDHVLDMLVVTHAHSDHYGGLISTSTWSNITSITTIVDYGYTGASYTSGYRSIRSSYVSKGSEYHPITELIMHSDGIYHISERMSLQFLNTNCYVAPGGATDDPNTTSICFLLTFDNTVFYMNGDSTIDADNGVRGNYPGLISADQVVVSKGAHHASDSNGSNGATFLRLFLKPDYVFISAAIDEVNQTSSGMVEAQHPHYAALTRFSVFTDQVYWNGINGTLTIHSDGTAITISGATRTLDYYVQGAVVNRASEKNLTIFESQWYLNYLVP
jgi:beta-lactamase superfamily II metal-dependent hydrolase